ncbi:hypothetical protein M413DRAFT_7405 [Hebeloma cylindrosporum]|uniref:Uncharacterized protein n=1 Tax=Hebeloma cylindrosporum TaxID=76867 RepID=A0A0C2Z5M4_HEBCY|nr:hypothetical protein M413DRAFT_7405 [Hebeloma cylindrosporum h7]
MNPELEEEPEARTSPELIEIPESSVFCTEKNSFGVYCKYALGPPTITPDEAFTLSSMSDLIPLRMWRPPSNYFAPFLNALTFLLMSWFYNSKGIISFNEVDKLVQEVIQHEDVNAADFGPTFSISHELKRLDKDQISTSPGSSEPLPFGPGDGWIESSVSIPVPCDGLKFHAEADAPRFEAYSEPAADKFHTTLFKEYWKPSEDEPEERIYSETFMADVFNDEYKRLWATPREGPNADLEPFIAAMMLYSDAIHLMNFGTASLYPLVKLGDDIQDFYQEHFGKPATGPMLTHLRHELAHAVLRLLLNDDLMHAYTDREAIKLFDQLIILKNCMCPRCLSLNKDISISKLNSSNNASAMKKLAARDYEDFLQLLFELVTWHAFAKLWQHTETMVTDLENLRTRLGKILQIFKNELCSEYPTKNLPSEEAARRRRKAATILKAGGQDTAATASMSTGNQAKKSKFHGFRMETYKLHSFPDVAASIRAHGVSENTSSKNERANIDGRNNFIPKFAREIMQRILFQAQQALKKNEKKAQQRQETRSLNIPLGEEEVLGPMPPEQHHHISKDVHHKVDVLKWLADNRDDPALNNFLPRLKDHLLSRLFKDDEGDGTFMNLDHMLLKLVNNRIYQHKVLRDSLNPRTHGDVMVLSRDDSYPYWYAHIIGIFHAMVLHTGQKSKSREAKKMEFLFGWETKKLHQIGFADSDGAFGFVDPADVVRAVHLIPWFSEGRTKDMLGPSIARFVDRDMFMRFRGGGVGHAAMRSVMDAFKNDHDDLDIQSREARNEAFNLEQEEEMAEEELNENKIARGGEERELSEGELLDYGYEQEIDLDEEEEGDEEDREEVDEEDREVGEEDNLTIDELEELGPSRLGVPRCQIKFGLPLSQVIAFCFILVLELGLDCKV